MKVSKLLAGAALVGTLVVPSIAVAANAYTTGNVNQRAGPSTNFPRVSTIPAGVAVTIFGCLRDLGWCDTSWRGQRGWVSGRYLEHLYDGRRVVVADYGTRIGVPIVSFNFGSYWGPTMSIAPGIATGLVGKNAGLAETGTGERIGREDELSTKLTTLRLENSGVAVLIRRSLQGLPSA